MDEVELLVLSKMAYEEIPDRLISKNFLGEHPPRTPLSCMLACIYMHIRHRHNPSSKNPGHGPVASVLSACLSINDMYTPHFDVSTAGMLGTRRPQNPQEVGLDVV